MENFNLSPHLTRKTCGRQKGFSLLEVLVAIVVLSVGLLGLAGLQVVGLQSNYSSYLRSQASILSYDIADAMRANRTAALSGSYVIALADTPAGTSVAATDLIAWRANLAAALPSGTGAIARPVATANRFTITLQWNDSRAGGSATQQFVTMIEL